MLTCSACLRRVLDTISGHSIPKKLYTGRCNPSSLRTTTKPSRLSRRYATVATQAPFTDTANPVVAAGYGDRGSKSVRWAARKELEYLNDSFHIANRVRAALDSDDFDLAAVITRQASKSPNMVVSWNHLIDYQLKNGRIHAAMKLYNEMKKRTQQPNAQTFTIIFRGCATSQHPKLAVGEAVKLYQNMLTIGRIKPNTIHLNAVLQVCANAGDLDSMFGVLTSADDPLRSPNNLTYTTILNAMRNKVEQSFVHENPSTIITDAERREKQNVVKQAKAIWDEVISRWRSGSLIIDEELVCAMGRLLLVGGYAEADAIESLIEQTMMIPRTDNRALSEPKEAESTALATPRPATKAPGAPKVNHAVPGNNSLSMILEALEKTGRTSKAIKYWNIFTTHHNVVPDAENWTRALRVFHRGKNSGRAVTCLQRMPADMITHKHTRLAMKTCLRDNLNKSALDNATTILKLVGKRPGIPDVQVLRIYLQVAHASKRSFDTDTKKDYIAAMNTWAKNLAAALEHLYWPCQTLAEYTMKTPITGNPDASGQALNFRAEVVALARKMCAAYDIVTNEYPASLTTDQVTKIKPRHTRLTRLISDHFQEMKIHRGQTAQRGIVDSNAVKQRGHVGDTKFKPRGNIGNSKTGRWDNIQNNAFEDKFKNRI